MPFFEKKTFIPLPASALYTYHAQPGAFDRLVPPGQRFQTLEATGGIEDGALRVMRLKKGPFWIPWTARHLNHVVGAGFTDVQEIGPFRSWTHEHMFLPEVEGAVLHDRIHWQLPFGFPLHWPIQRELVKMFTFRHRRTYDDLIRQAPYATLEPLEVVICGKLTRLAQHLAAFLSTAGHQVYRLRHETSSGKGRFIMEGFYSHQRCHPLEGASALIYTGQTNNPGDEGQPDPLAFWDFLDRACATLSQPPQTLIHIVGQQLPLDQFSQDPALKPDRRLQDHKIREATQVMLERLEEWIPRRVNLHLGTVIGAPFVQMIQELLHLECFLFLKNGVKTLNFGWIAQDDALSAILHAMVVEQVRGDYSVMAPERATRASFQELLLKHNFFAYSWHRLLRVLPWAEPGSGAGLRSDLDQIQPLAETGFQPWSSELSEALDSGLGTRRSPSD